MKTFKITNTAAMVRTAPHETVYSSYVIQADRMDATQSTVFFYRGDTLVARIDLLAGQLVEEVLG